MNTDKTSLENEIQPSCLGAVRNSIQERIKNHEQEIKKCQDEIDSHKGWEYTWKIKIAEMNAKINVYKIRISELQLVIKYCF